MISNCGRSLTFPFLCPRSVGTPRLGLLLFDPISLALADRSANLPYHSLNSHLLKRPESRLSLPFFAFSLWTLPLEKDRPNWFGTLFSSTLVGLGSILVLFPAWLPRASTSGVDLEDSAVEILQLVLLIFSMAILLAASAHAGRFRPIYQALALGCLAAALGEASWLDDLLPFNPDWLLIPNLGAIIMLFIKNPRETLRFVGLSARHPASGFIAAAIIIAYVFAQFFGSHTFWEASLEGEVPSGLPQICASYLELLACYFIFVGVVGFTLPLRRGKDNL